MRSPFCRRDYAFAARSGRLGTNALNSAYLQQCQAEILVRGKNVRTWSTNNAYGTSLDNFSKEIYDKGYSFTGPPMSFSLFAAFDSSISDCNADFGMYRRNASVKSSSTYPFADVSPIQIVLGRMP